MQIDFQKKYIKYKLKYHLLKSQGKKGKKKVDNTLKLNFNSVDNLLQIKINEEYKKNFFNKLNKGYTDEYKENVHKLFNDKDYKQIVKNIKKEYQKYKELKLNILTLGLKGSDELIIIGDIHSSLYSLLQIIKKLKDDKKINDNFQLIDSIYLVFLGDLIDRGPYSIEVLLIAMKLKLSNPAKVIILNGNHEDPGTFIDGGTGDEFKKELKSKMMDNLIKNFFNRLPMVLFVRFENDPKYFQLCHGGIEPTFNPIDHLPVPENNNGVNLLKQIVRESNLPVTKEEKYESHGLKWSDFNVDGDNKNCTTNTRTFKPNCYLVPEFNEDRGAGYIYGINLTNKYLIKNNLYSIISGHQDTMNLAILPKYNDITTIQKKVKGQDFKFNKGGELYWINYNNNYCELILDPTEDFSALVTSTATGPKYYEPILTKTSFLSLKKENDKHKLVAYFIDLNKSLV